MAMYWRASSGPFSTRPTWSGPIWYGSPTIRGISPELAGALKREVRRRGQSLNETVRQVLERALGLEAGQPFDNGLGRFAGTWTQEEFEAFEKATEVFERIDEEHWR
jgi:hypothetical protein